MIVNHDPDPDRAIKLTIKQLREHWCVYVHSTEDDPTFYAGICRIMDVYKYPDAYKNSHWRQTVNDTTLLTTTIICSGDAQECHRRLYEFSRTMKPTCNSRGYQMTGNIAITCVEGPNAGKTYATQDECAKMNGLSQPALSNHLNGRAGYLTIRGMIFKRGLP